MRRVGLFSLSLFAAWACSEPPTEAEVGECLLGSVYVDAPLINPDAPVYEDADWTQARVEQAFAEARASGSDAYEAYLAAYTYPDVMECPFCACGCEPLLGHLSAVDCFKDMHGFT